MASPEWYWAPTPDLYPLADLRAERKEARFRLGLRPPPIRRGEVAKGASARLARVSADNTELWTVTPPIDALDSGALGGAAMATDGDRVYIAHYNRIASGCRLSAFAAGDGHRLWSVTLQGIGPIGHSKYHNRVQLRVTKGNPTVFGAESGGRYIESRVAATGEPDGLETLPYEELPTPLAEPLFDELSNMLATRARYEVTAEDFLARHVLTDRYPAGAERERAWREAIEVLDGVAFAGGARGLELERVGLRLRATRVALAAKGGAPR